MMKLDQKFRGTIVKNKDDTVVPDDQWVVFLAKDNAFADLVREYPERCRIAGAAIEQIHAAVDLVNRIDIWRDEHPELCRAPDIEPNELKPE